MARIFLVRINAAGKSCRRTAPTFGSKTLLTGKPNYDRGFHLCPSIKNVQGYKARWGIAAAFGKPTFSNVVSDAVDRCRVFILTEEIA
jgi:hypothetical protein